jgi:hypothetical protein
MRVGVLELAGPRPGGAFSPRARRTSPAGAFSPRVRRTSPEGAFGYAALAGRGGHQGCERLVRAFLGL